jgi:class 3 adenylate cyclase
MSLSKSDYIINESIDIKSDKTIDVAILFTDMVGSSKLWKDDPENMIIALEQQSKLMDKTCKKFKGYICKTIGDAFMVAFDTIEDAIKCALFIQTELKDNPIPIGKQNTLLRIGICYGPVYSSKIKLQNNITIDYFGNTVNTASRIEGGVSPEGGIAFCITSEDAAEINLDSLLKGLNVDLISFTNKGDEVKRSNRTLTDIHRHIYKNIKQLKGIDKIDVFKIKL